MKALKNKVQLIGNVGNDPEVKTVGEIKKVANLSIATNERYKNHKGESVNETQWHRLVAWGKTAGLIEKYVTKGKMIAIEGKLIHRTFEDKNGEKRYVTEVVIGELLFF